MTHTLRALGGWTLALCLSSPAPLPAEIAVTGRLTDEHQRPLAGAEVRLSPAPTLYRRGTELLTGKLAAEPLAASVSDSAGRYRLVAPAAGLWRVEISAAGRVPLQRTLSLVEPHELGDTPLRAATACTVRVRGPRGEPVAGARVQMETHLRPPSQWQSAPRSALTDEHGEVRLPTTDGGPRSIFVVAAGYAPAEARSEQAVFEISLARAQPVGISVHDAAGRPRARALLALADGDLPLALTDEAGRTEVALSAGEKRHVVAITEDLYAAIATLAQPPRAGAALEIVLRAPVRLTGTVRDYGSRAPLHRALVSTRQPEDGLGALTDARGEYALAVPALRSNRDLAAATGEYFPSNGWALAKAENAPIEFLLSRRDEIAGRVVDELGQPVAGATLWPRLTNPRHIFDSSLWEERQSLRSGRDGSFSFPAAANRPYQLEVTAAGFAPLKRIVETGGEVEIVLRRGSSVSGRLVTPDGEPVVSGQAELSRFHAEGSGWLSFHNRISATESDDQGRFRLADLAPGTYRLRAAALDSPASPWQAVLVEDLGQAIEVGDVVVESAARLAGRVLDERGRPLAEIEVSAREEISLASTLREENLWTIGDEPWSGVSYGPVRTDGEGRFELTGLRRGVRVRLETESARYHIADPITVEIPSEAPIEIRLLSSATLRGSVTDERGQAIARAHVEAHRVEGATIEDVLAFFDRSEHRTSTMTDDDGRFELTEITPGEVELEASAEGRSCTRMRLVLEPGQALGGLRIVLDAGATIEGRVTDEHGTPLGDVTIRAEKIGLRALQGGSRDRETTSADNGSYALAGLEPGRYSIVIRHESYAPAREAVEISSGFKHLDLVLRSGGSVRGTVVDEGDRPVPGALVSLGRWNAESGWLGTYRDYSATDGTFAIEGPAPGRYPMTVDHDDFAAKDLEVEVGDRPIEGLRVVLRGGGRLRGRVLGLAPESLPHVVVRAFSARDGGKQAVLDSDSRFELSDLAQGDWSLMVTELRSGRTTSRGVRVEGPETEVEIEIDAADAISGLLRLEGRPISAAGVGVLESGNRAMSTLAITGPDGRFELQGLSAGPRTLALILPQQLASVQREVTLEPGAELVIDLRFGRLVGRVVDAASGEPVARARLGLLALASSVWEPHRSDRSFNQAESDDSGTFRLAPAIEGSYELVVEAPGYALQRLPIALAPGDADLVVSLARANE